MAKRAATSTSRSTSSSAKSKPLNASMRVVLLRGPELFLHGTRTRELVQILQSAHGEIEQFRFDGETATLAQVLDELRTYGLMQQHKLVILDHADEFLKTSKPGAADNGEIDEDESTGEDSNPNRPALERYVQAPSDSATLLLRAETWRPGRIDSMIEKVGTIIRCEEMSPAETATLAVDRAARVHNVQLAPQAANLLVDRVGTNLARVDVELARLSAFVGEKGSIPAQIVKDMVEPTREEKAWEIQEAILTGKPGHALTKLNELIEISRQPDQLLYWSVADLLRKLYHAARLTQAGEHSSAISRKLRLWGSSQYAIMNAATRTRPRVFAQFLHDVLDADMGSKTGRHDPRRTLEGIVVKVADSIRS